MQQRAKRGDNPSELRGFFWKTSVQRKWLTTPKHESGKLGEILAPESRPFVSYTSTRALTRTLDSARSIPHPCWESQFQICMAGLSEGRVEEALAALAMPSGLRLLPRELMPRQTCVKLGRNHPLLSRAEKIPYINCPAEPGLRNKACTQTLVF